MEEHSEHPMNQDAVVTRELSKLPPMVRSAYNYLSELPYVLWADWDISIPLRRLEAAKWLVEQCHGLIEHWDRDTRPNDIKAAGLRLSPESPIVNNAPE